MKKGIKRIIFIASTLLLLISFVALVVLIGPENIVEGIGVENTYILFFLFAVFGGVSAFTAPTFYAAMGTLFIVEIDPVSLALIGAVGLAIGDSLFYYMGLKGHELTKKTRYKEKITKVQQKINKVPKKWTTVFIFLYAAISIFPNDILCLVMGISRYPYVKFITPIFFGNLCFNFIILYLVSIGFVHL
ncbi:MAG: VTT domain-containing protein [Candidatus Nanoarchaeia archaeon]